MQDGVGNNLVQELHNFQGMRDGDDFVNPLSHKLSQLKTPLYETALKKGRTEGRDKL